MAKAKAKKKEVLVPDIITDENGDWMDNIPLEDMEAGAIGAAAEQAEKVRRMLSLKLGGATWDQVAEAVGYSSGSNACRATRQTMEEAALDTAKEIKMRQWQRLEHILMLHWTAMNEKDSHSTAIVLSCIDRVNALLGLHDTRIDITDNGIIDVNDEAAVLVIDGDEEEFIASIQRVRLRMEAAGLEE